MADPEHLKLIEDGASLWNEWWANGNSYPDLSGADLTNTDLKNFDLSRADLTNANLTGANLRRANLTDADLNNAVLSSANFSRANFQNADLRGADAKRSLLISSVTDFEFAENLTQSQIDRMNGDDSVLLPVILDRPLKWSMEEKVDVDTGNQSGAIGGSPLSATPIAGGRTTEVKLEGNEGFGQGNYGEGPWGGENTELEFSQSSPSAGAAISSTKLETQDREFVSGVLDSSKNIRDLSSTELKIHIQNNRISIVATSEILISSIDDYLEKIKYNNILNAEYPEFKSDLEKFLKSIYFQTKSLQDSLIPSEEIGEEDLEKASVKAASWWSKFVEDSKSEAERYFSAENIAKAAVPTIIILSFAATGFAVGGPFVGPGLGWIGNLITNQLKPKDFVDELVATHSKLESERNSTDNE